MFTRNRCSHLFFTSLSGPLPLLSKYHKNYPICCWDLKFDTVMSLYLKYYLECGDAFCNLENRIKGNDNEMTLNPNFKSKRSQSHQI